MRPPFNPILILLSSILFFSGCALQPSQTDTCQPVTVYDYHFEEEDEFQTYNDRFDTSQCSYMQPQPQQVYHGESDRELARFMGIIVYSIIEGVIKGIVYGLAHHR